MHSRPQVSILPKMDEGLKSDEVVNEIVSIFVSILPKMDEGLKRKSKI